MDEQGEFDILKGNKTIGIAGSHAVEFLFYVS
jgi:hypothetical protein